MRGRPKEENKMDKRLNLRMSLTLYSQLKNAAQISGQTMVDYIRMRLVGIKIPKQDKARIVLSGRTLQLIRELRRQGGLLKHTINQIEDNPLSTIAMFEVKDAANKCEEVITEIERAYKNI